MKAEVLWVGGDQRAGTFAAAAGSLLPAATSALAVGVAGVGVADLFWTAGTARAITGTAAAVVVLALVGLRAWLARGDLPDRWANPVLAGALLAGQASVLVQLGVTGNDRGTGSTVILLLASGALLLDTRWQAGTMGVLCVSWIGTVSIVVPVAAWTQWLPVLLAATGLAAYLGARRRADVVRAAEMHERAERAAVQDALTGLLNRRGVAIVGEQLVAAARRAGNAVHCTFVDLDELADVNDRFGHLAGDRVVLAVADAVRLSVRSGDVVARWGGHEFCVLGPGPGTAPVELENRIVARVQELPPDDVPGWRPTVSAGSAMLAPWDDGDLASLLDQADREMFRRRGLRRQASVRSARPVLD